MSKYNIYTKDGIQMVKSERTLTKGYYYYELMAINFGGPGHYSVKLKSP